MELEVNEKINQPVNDVYSLVRDDLDKLVPYLPNVEKIEVKKHAPTGEERIEVINHWYGKVEMPGMLKKFLSPEIFSWKDIATWNNNDKAVEYRLESFLANDLFDAKGKNYFIDNGDGTTDLKITCSVKIYPEKVPGIPRLLAKKVTPMIETLMEKLLGPNLTSLGDGLQKYFNENR
mgnify:CR=1 FL=1